MISFLCLAAASVLPANYVVPSADSEAASAMNIVDFVCIQKEEPRKQTQHCLECRFKYYCGGECPVEIDMRGGINMSNCELKTHLIELAAFLKLYALEKNRNLFAELNGFCKEKAARFKIDADLWGYCEKHPELAFTEAKARCDKLCHKY